MVSVEMLRIWEMQRRRALDEQLRRVEREQLITLSRALAVLRVT